VILEPFAELALLLVIAAVAGAIALRLHQPVLIAYIVVGIAVGPAGLGLVSAHDQIDVLAQFGIAVLLFVVGLKLDLTRVRDIGSVALATGLGQLAFTILFVFIAMGITLGHVGVEALGLTTLVGLVTITLSTYMILYSHSLYRLLAPLLGVFERRVPHRELEQGGPAETEAQPQVLVLGLGRYGLRLARRLREAGIEVLGVDFDPELPHHLAADEVPVRFGDAQDPDFLDTLPLAGMRWAISTLPDSDSNRALMHALLQHGFSGEIVVVARDEQQGAELWLAGAPVILYPFRDAVDFAAANLIAIMQRQSAGGRPAADQ